MWSWIRVCSQHVCRLFSAKYTADPPPARVMRCILLQVVSIVGRLVFLRGNVGRPLCTHQNLEENTSFQSVSRWCWYPTRNNESFNLAKVDSIWWHFTILIVLNEMQNLVEIYCVLITSWGLRHSKIMNICRFYFIKYTKCKKIFRSTSCNLKIRVKCLLLLLLNHKMLLISLNS